MSYFACLLLISIGVCLVISFKKLKNWRKILFLIIAAVWTISLGVTMVGMLGEKHFFESIKSGDINAVNTLLSEKPGLIRTRTFFNETALHVAVRSGNDKMVTYLLKSGIDINAKDSSNITPLHLAVFYGNTQITETLLEAGANVNAVGFRQNETPLHVAASYGYVNVVKLLLAHGADVGARDLLGKTPLEWAKDERQTNIVVILSNLSLSKQ